MTEAPFRRATPARMRFGDVTIKSWRLRNFKSVREASIELCPLSLVVGANSAGKSTLLQSILAACQAVGSGGISYPLNGGVVRLGQVNEVRHRGPEVDTPTGIGIGASFELRPRNRLGLDGRPVRSDVRGMPAVAVFDWMVGLGGAVEKRSGSARISSLEVAFTPLATEQRRTSRRDVGEEAPLELTVTAVARQTDDASDEDSIFSELMSRSVDVSGSIVRGGMAPERVVRVATEGGFPVSASVIEDAAHVIARLWVEIRAEGPWSSRRRPGNAQMSMLTDVNEVLPVALSECLSVFQEAGNVDRNFYRRVRRALIELVEERATDGPLLPFAYPPEFVDELARRLQSEDVVGDVAVPTRLDEIGSISSLIVDYLRNGVRYLGPLREDPKVAYLDSPESDSGYVGQKGEYTAAVLQRFGSTSVVVPMPGGHMSQRSTLSRAVNAWSKDLGVGDAFGTSDEGRFGIQLQVTQPDVDIPLDLTSVGTGVSQILPVLVMCLQAPVGSLLLIEQPELHLNPKVQQRLADFLIAIANSGRNLMVETHSEYLISRLRLRIAESESDAVQKQIGIFFANKIDGATTYVKVKTNDYGSIEEWPDNFFDQATEETHAILSAAVKKRRARASSEK